MSQTLYPVSTTHGSTRRPLARALALISAGLLIQQSAPVLAQDDVETLRLPTILVLGENAADVSRQPGAVSLVLLEDLILRQPRSTEEALRAVPGITIKPEEESAIVANIGMRGLSSGDYKTLILEDGVPVAPGLFVGNGRYYNPRIQRMESIEVLKGAASLRYGPSTIGGVINYVTKQPRDGVEVALRAGSWNTQEGTLEVGASSTSGDATFGAIINNVRSDGFLDKGYDTTDIMIKAGMAIGSNQRVSIKYADYSNDANISYRGHFLQEYRNEARNNPAPDDYFLTERRSLDLNHEWDINSTARLNTLIFGSEMFRDYWRYGTNNAASAAAGSWVYTNTLNGNNRAFERFGVDTRLNFEHQLFGMSSEAELGLRYMDEEMDDKTVQATRATPRTGPLGKDTLDTAESFALYAQNRFLLTDTVALTAGLRIEQYEQDRLDRRLNATQNNFVSSDNTEVMPGVGLSWQMSPELQLFGSVYKAFSPSLNGDALNGMQDQQLDAERSVNMEFGMRGANERMTYEFAMFRMDFDNQIIPANSNSQFQVTNGGETLHQGLEFGVGFDLGSGFHLNTNATYVSDAEFRGNRLARNGAITTPDGNRIPYTPEWVANAALEYETGNLRSGLSVHHTGKQYTDVLNTTTLAESTSGFFTGQVPAYTVADLYVVYSVNDQLSLNAAVKNLADKQYIASLRQGVYVGVERSFDVGLRYRF
ncbi:MAG: TonB-dependent receptor [Pseudohongiella sp.]|nr:TonB-dependent receptor [Pseudohongiella sp.]MDP2127929.1 TonB-dependent receptor [Pseudohongiella sp.]